ncbi:MAG: adenosylmethionine--8-amino-7-oxononanoate transaminase [Verrucomicrobia bacterium]|nr:adenosylmethionine--8-amino-7-oxononanoate transaminase [Verrucomicrobiota bacterium]
MNRLARLDHKYLWHPFTQMKDWLREEPILIVAGEGPELIDARGNRYLDANASIWTNLHGHRRPDLDEAVRVQLERIAHSSALGLANEPASLLAEQLVKVANPPGLFRGKKGEAAALPGPRLAKVFYSDDGSTAMEAGLKMAYEFARRTGRGPKPRFLSLGAAYHGDTIGAVSLGHIDLFHAAYRGLLFKTDQVPSPFCYRCRFNKAKPERADAREYRRCRWECLKALEQRLERARKRGRPYSAFVFEPLIQGAAGMRPQPEGWLRRAAALVRDHGALLIADEIMTGFGRTGFRPGDKTRNPLFACHHEGVQPDLMALAKGLTGGYLPMAATLSSQSIFDAFLGEYAEFKTFFHGHSYTGNQLGAAVSLASLRLLRAPETLAARRRLQRALTESLSRLWKLPAVGDIRQTGLVAGVELVKDWKRREPWPAAAQTGARVCRAMARRGVLTRPVGDVVVIMPPYCMSEEQIERVVEALDAGIRETLGS